MARISPGLSSRFLALFGIKDSGRAEIAVDQAIGFSAWVQARGAIAPFGDATSGLEMRVQGVIGEVGVLHIHPGAPGGCVIWGLAAGISQGIIIGVTPESDLDTLNTPQTWNVKTADFGQCGAEKATVTLRAGTVPDAQVISGTRRSGFGAASTDPGSYGQQNKQWGSMFAQGYGGGWIYCPPGHACVMRHEDANVQFIVDFMVSDVHNPKLQQ